MSDEKIIVVVDKKEDVDGALALACGLTLEEVHAVFVSCRDSDEAFERFSKLAAVRGCRLELTRDSGQN